MNDEEKIKIPRIVRIQKNKINEGIKIPKDNFRFSISAENFPQSLFLWKSPKKLQIFFW